MTRRAGVLPALLLLGVACADRRPEGDAIVVAMLNSPANLDPRVGADEASQKAQQLIFNTLVNYAQAQRLIAGDVPYSSLWYKTNVAVFQPELQGVRLSPTADFLFLKDVHRSGAPLTAGGAE
jgi:ABC-type transport system substrate-binding protein